MITNYTVFVGWLGLHLITFYVYVRMFDIKEIPLWKIISTLLFSGFMTVGILQHYPFLFEVIFNFGIFVFVAIYGKVKLNLRLAGTLIAVGIAGGSEVLANTILVIIHGIIEYLNWFIASIRAGVVFFEMPPVDPLMSLNPAYNPRFLISPILWEVVVFLLSFSLMIGLFRLKRLKHGFVFLEIKEFRIVGVIISVLIMIAKSAWRFIARLFEQHGFSGTDIPSLAFIIMLGIAVGMFGIHIWWKSSTKTVYVRRQIDRTLIALETENNQLKMDNERLATIIHKDNKLIPAMYDTVLRKTQEKTLLDEMQDLLDNLKNIMNERKGLIAIQPQQTNNETRIDSILNYMNVIATEKGVTSELTVTDSFTNMINDHLAIDKMETLIADLIENAINATPAGGKFKIAMIESENAFVLTVWDTGIPFEIPTLNDIGIKRSTARQTAGGSGIGYMTLFEIIQSVNASLTISEYDNAEYSKSIAITFDKQSKFVIESYRAEELRLKLTRTDVEIKEIN